MIVSKKKTHVTEIFAGLLAVLGLGAGVAAWWLGAHLAESAGIAIGFLCPSVLFALVGQGLRTGNMGSQDNKILRDKQPFKFWGFAMFYTLTGCLFFFAVLLMLVLGL